MWRLGAIPFRVGFINLHTNFWGNGSLWKRKLAGTLVVASGLMLPLSDLFLCSNGQPHFYLIFSERNNLSSNGCPTLGDRRETAGTISNLITLFPCRIK